MKYAKYAYWERLLNTWNMKRTIDTLDFHQVRVHNGLIEMLLQQSLGRRHIRHIPLVNLRVPTPLGSVRVNLMAMPRSSVLS